MKRNSKSIGKQMARIYIKKYSSNPLEYTEGTLSDNDKSFDSISVFPKKNSKKERVELLDIKQNTNFENYHSANNSYKYLDINKLDSESTINSKNSSSKTLSNLSQPLLVENISRREANNQYPRYKVERYDENCIDESKIEYIECLLEEQNKNFFYYLLSIVTLGLFALVLEKFPLIKIKFGYLRARISSASHFFIKCRDGKFYIKKAYEIKLPRLNNNNLVNLTKLPIIATQTKFFEFKLHKYAYSPEIKNFVSVTFKINVNANYEIISRKMIGGLSEEEINYQKIFIYKNKYYKISDET